MIRKHLTRAAYALAAVVIAGSSVPVFAQEAEEAVTVEAAEEVVLAQETENTEETGNTVTKKKLRKHRHKKNTDATEDATAVAEDGTTTVTKKVKKAKPTTVAEDGTVITKEKKARPATVAEDGTVIEKVKKEKPTTVAEDGTVTPKKSRKPGRKPAKKVTTDDTAATENTQ